MVVVPTNKLKPGMLLAEEARDVRGKLILAKGKRIYSSQIKKFKIWGVTEVNISEDVTLKDKPQPHDNSETIEKTKESVKYIFSYVDLEHPAIKEIFRLSVEYRSISNAVVEEKKITEKIKRPINNNRSEDFLKRLSKKK